VKWRDTCLNPRVNYSRFALAGATVLSLWLSGCSSVTKTVQKVTAPPENGKVYAITTDSAAFFHRGPQEGREPDMKLSKDTLVKLVRPSFGYSKVKLVATGELGYVASDEIKTASPVLIASTATARTEPSVSAQSPSPSAEQFNIDSSDPRLVPPPEDLPDPDLSAPAPEQ
jgi:predicted Rdx family selenoprotein